MSINTIKAHSDNLKANNPEQYIKFRQALVSFGEEVYFDRTLCSPSSKRPEYDLRQVRFIVADLMCEFLPGFETRHFRTNKLPPLPEQIVAKDVSYA